MDARALVARNIRRLRVARLLSQEALAIEAGIDRTLRQPAGARARDPHRGGAGEASKALAAPITELFAVPRPREKPPATLPSGRKRAS